jgi:hypothetical protein
MTTIHATVRVDETIIIACTTSCTTSIINNVAFMTGIALRWLDNHFGHSLGTISSLCFCSGSSIAHMQSFFFMK